MNGNYKYIMNKQSQTSDKG